MARSSHLNFAVARSVVPGLLLAFALYATARLLAEGDLGHAVAFGVLAGLAAVLFGLAVRRIRRAARGDQSRDTLAVAVPGGIVVLVMLVLLGWELVRHTR